MAVNFVNHVALSITTSALRPVHDDICAKTQDFHVSSSRVFGRHHILRVCLVVTNVFM